MNIQTHIPASTRVKLFDHAFRRYVAARLAMETASVDPTVDDAALELYVSDLLAAEGTVLGLVPGDVAQLETKAGVLATLALEGRVFDEPVFDVLMRDIELLRDEGVEMARAA